MTVPKPADVRRFLEDQMPLEAIDALLQIVEAQAARIQDIEKTLAHNAGVFNLHVHDGDVRTGDEYRSAHCETGGPLKNHSQFGSGEGTSMRAIIRSNAEEEEVIAAFDQTLDLPTVAINPKNTPKAHIMRILKANKIIHEDSGVWEGDGDDRTMRISNQTGPNTHVTIGADIAFLIFGNDEALVAVEYPSVGMIKVVKTPDYLLWIGKFILRIKDQYGTENVIEKEPEPQPIPKRPYDGVDNRKLSRWMMTARVAKKKLVTCEFGHPRCGCSTAERLDGQAPCAQAALAEQQRRKGRRV